MSFSSEIKKELCGLREMDGSEMRAMLYGMFYAGGCCSLRVTNGAIAVCARQLIEEVFPDIKHETTRLVKKGGSVYIFGIKEDENSERLFGDFSGINYDIVSGNDEQSGAFLRGVFLSCGSLADPNKEYHLELVIPDEWRAKSLKEFISEHGMNVKLTTRQRRYVIYAKESETIEDFLTYIGAGLRSLEIMQIKIEKSLRNRVNREVNCETANLDKTVAAANRCCDDIRYIFREKGADWLKPELRETALLRLQNSEASLSELCKLSDPPISRSGLDHRLKKLSVIAEKLRNNEL